MRGNEETTHRMHIRYMNNEKLCHKPIVSSRIPDVILLYSRAGAANENIDYTGIDSEQFLRSKPYSL